MNIFKLAYRNIIFQPLNVLLSLVLFALGTGLIAFILLLNTQVQQKFENNLANINLIIGAKGSPLQLVLCNMYHIDVPTGNINLKEAAPFLNPKHPLIKKAYPISLGDSYEGYRVVGSTPDLLNAYETKIGSGRLWKHDMEVVLGATVARELHLHIGDRFHSSHGVTQGDDLEHDHALPFRVVGILESSNSVLDQLILTNTGSLWLVHDHNAADSLPFIETTVGGDEHHHDHYHNHDEVVDEPEIEAIYAQLPTATNTNAGLLEHLDEEITALLITFRANNFKTLSMSRAINENTNMLAASPAYELNRMYDMMGSSEQILRMIALVIVIVSAISIFLMLFNSLRERTPELALLRVMGATPSKLFGLLLSEGIIIAILGSILGLTLAHVAFGIAANWLQTEYQYSFDMLVFVKEEIYIFVAGFIIGILAALIPAFRALKLDVPSVLSK